MSSYCGFAWCPCPQCRDRRDQQGPVQTASHLGIYVTISVPALAQASSWWRSFLDFQRHTTFPGFLVSRFGLSKAFSADCISLLATNVLHGLFSEPAPPDPFVWLDDSLPSQSHNEPSYDWEEDILEDDTVSLDDSLPGQLHTEPSDDSLAGQVPAEPSYEWEEDLFEDDAKPSPAAPTQTPELLTSGNHAHSRQPLKPTPLPAHWSDPVDWPGYAMALENSLQTTTASAPLAGQAASSSLRWCT